MIRVRLQIEDGEIKDAYDAYGLIYLTSDKYLSAPTKGHEESSYAEEAGVHIDPRTVDDKFEYKVQFLVEAPNRDLVNANAKIKAFNDLMYTQQEDSDIKTFKEFTFYSDNSRNKIVGYPDPISKVDEKDFFRDKNKNVHDAVKVELTIKVPDPRKCDFSTDTDHLEI